MDDRPRLDAVLFDAGGTLVRLDFEWMADALTALGVPATPETLRRAEIAGRRRYDASLERRAADEAPLADRPAGAYFAGMVEALGGDAADVERALERFAARHHESGLWTRPMEGARATLDALRAMPLALAVVSNSDGRAEMHLRDCGVLDGLAFVVDSHLVGYEKPDPRIFAVAIDRLGVPADRTLFIGDILSVDRTGARDAGTRFVLIDPWGDYGPADVPRIASIADLPAFIHDHYSLATRGDRALAAEPSGGPS